MQTERKLKTLVAFTQIPAVRTLYAYELRSVTRQPIN